MLRRLNIKNYIIISELDFSPTEGLNIITGETGAGKSILVGALNLLSGNRADAKLLLDNQKKAVIEGVFDCSPLFKSYFDELDIDFDTETILRREIAPNGKTRAFVNDTPVTLEQLESLAQILFNIHNQHDNLLIGSKAYQLALIDFVAETSDKVSQLKLMVRELEQLNKNILVLEESRTEMERTAEFDNFVLAELINANLKETNEEEALTQELELLSNVSLIRESIELALNELAERPESTSDLLGNVLYQLRRITNYGENFKILHNRLESVVEELKDITNELRIEQERIETDPERKSEIEERLSLFYSLQKKHKVNNIGQLIELRDTLNNRTKQGGDLSAQIDELHRKKAELWSKATEAAKKISGLRKKAIPVLIKGLTQLLKDAGMPNAKVEFEVAEQPLDASGIDLVNLLFAANKGGKLLPIKQAASGGEFSRFMLAVKAVQAKTANYPCIVFDEIDTGISGEVARKVGHIMYQLAQGRQLIVITHLPQIAALAQTHHYISKKTIGSNTHTQIEKLNQEAQIREIAQMLSGEKITEASLENAKQLIGEKNTK